MRNGYQKIIKGATGCDDSELKEIENFMRDIIFHSTLDWQTREQLEKAAREAHATLRYLREKNEPLPALGTSSFTATRVTGA